MSTTPEPLILRPAHSEDDEFLQRLYASGRVDEGAIRLLDETQRNAFIKMQFAAQQLHYQTYFPEAEHLVMMLHSVPIGRLYIARRDDEIRILDISLLPEHRGRGIGTSLIQEIISEAKEEGKPVRIYVERLNRSLRLFERLRFARAEDIGTHYLMEFRPISGESSDPH